MQKRRAQVRVEEYQVVLLEVLGAEALVGLPVVRQDRLQAGGRAPLLLRGATEEQKKRGWGAGRAGLLRPLACFSGSCSNFS